MKKTILFILMIGTILVFAGCGSDEVALDQYNTDATNTSEATNDTTNNSSSLEAKKALSSSVTSKKELINEFIKQVLGSYTDCEVTSLTILDAHSVEAPGTYNGHGIITFSGSASADVAGTLIQAYSNDLAEKLDRFYPALTELELVWIAPEFHGRATLNYEKVKNYLQITSYSSNSNFGLKVDIEALTEETIEKAGAMSADPIE